jgi:hypothetical protein
MPAKSKAQQRFMGMVCAVKNGEMEAPSPEVAQAAASMSKGDACDFASTKHKKLPEKVVAKEQSRYDRYDDENKRFAKSDNQMKFGKFYDIANDAKNRLRKGEVRKFNKETGKWESNKG